MAARRARRAGALGSAALLLLLALPACRIEPRHPPPGPLDGPIRRGLACLAGSYDGNSFRDEYLSYVYPGEKLQSPLPGYRLTYRILDAYFIVLMMREAGIEPGPARLLFQRAEAVTAALVPVWRRKGIYNLRRNPAPGGIALDTYAVLARLRRDPRMCGVVEAGLDGDGWLPPGFYQGDESFRRIADESWGVRALLAAGPHRELGVRVLERICRDALAELAEEKDPVTRALLVIHALEALDEVPPAEAGKAGAAGTLRSDATRLRKEGIGLLGESAVRRDTLTFANLAGSLARDGSLRRKDSRAILAELLRRQREDGCWAVSLDEPGGSGRVFATGRVLLALAELRNAWPGLAAAPAGGKGTGEAP